MTSRRLLVVEDDGDTREMLREVLELEGYRVRAAVDGIEALERLAGPERFAAVLLDLMLPAIDGAGVLEAMASDPALCRVPVVAMSASPPQQLVFPVAAFLRKPFELEALLERLARLTPGAARGRDALGRP